MRDFLVLQEAIIVVAIHRAKALFCCLRIERVLSKLGKWAKLQAPSSTFQAERGHKASLGALGRQPGWPGNQRRAYQSASSEWSLKRWPGAETILTFSSRGRFNRGLPNFGASAQATKDAMFGLLKIWYQASTRYVLLWTVLCGVIINYLGYL
jgi:hypothetical protein